MTVDNNVGLLKTYIAIHESDVWRARVEIACDITGAHLSDKDFLDITLLVEDRLKLDQRLLDALYHGTRFRRSDLQSISDYGVVDSSDISDNEIIELVEQLKRSQVGLAVAGVVTTAVEDELRSKLEELESDNLDLRIQVETLENEREFLGQ